MGFLFRALDRAACGCIEAARRPARNSAAGAIDGHPERICHARKYRLRGG